MDIESRSPYYSKSFPQPDIEVSVEKAAEKLPPKVTDLQLADELLRRKIDNNRNHLIFLCSFTNLPKVYLIYNVSIDTRSMMVTDESGAFDNVGFYEDLYKESAVSELEVHILTVEKVEDFLTSARQAVADTGLAEHNTRYLLGILDELEAKTSHAWPRNNPLVR